jgi:NitT/TauT family transport system ATP-binding protein
VETIQIDLPRPRNLDMINTAKFGEIVHHIREKLGREMYGS